MSIERAQAIIADRGTALRADELREIRLLVAEAPLERQHEAIPWLAEAVALLVGDPDYKGDVTAADLAAW